MHQPATILGISTAQNISFGRGSQAHAQEYANTHFTSAMPAPDASEGDWKAYERKTKDPRVLAITGSQLYAMTNMAARPAGGAFTGGTTQSPFLNLMSGMAPALPGLPAPAPQQSGVPTPILQQQGGSSQVPQEPVPNAPWSAALPSMFPAGIPPPSFMMNVELPEEQKQQVQTLLAELREVQLQRQQVHIR